MGLDTDNLSFLLLAADEGVDFGRTLTIGRQWIYGIDERALERSFGGFDRRLEPNEAGRLLEEEGGYAGAVLRRLGTDEVVALDASEYEGSEIVHDLNRPLPEDLRRRFSAVVDCGSLEHVFNFPTALASCMDMVAPGGHLLLMTPTNNFFGHGFYQTSPELYFRVLNPKNGFVVERVMIRDWRRRERWFEVADPAEVGRRVTLIGSMPMVLFVRARRVNDAPPFATAPQQSDYESRWETGTPGAEKLGAVSSEAGLGRRAVGLLKRLRGRAPRPVKELAATYIERRRRFYDRAAYRAVSPEALAREARARNRLGGTLLDVLGQDG